MSTPSALFESCKEKARNYDNLHDIKKIKNSILFPNQIVSQSRNISIAGEDQDVKKNWNIKTFITQDKKLLDQYYNLRNEIFRSDRGWIKKTWFENEFDRAGSIIVALDGDKLVGGVRIMVSTNGENLSGEFANTKYTYPNLFKHMNLPANEKYAELDGLVVAKEYRNRIVTEKILARSIEHALNFDCSYLIGIALLAYCRIYQMAYKAIGYSNVYIVKDYMWSELEEYNFSRDYPIVNIIKQN